MKRIVKVGSRKSPLALAQTNEVITLLKKHHPEVNFEVVGVVTEGDRNVEGPRRGKDSFVKAIEEKLLDGEVDIAIHSLKDMPVQTPKPLVIAAVPRREDPRDALISKTGKKLDELPKGAKIGTSSLRRKTQLLKIRPDLELVDIRGNVGTRIEKLRRLNLDALLLAYAGLMRLGLQDVVTEVIDTGIIIPAAGQGALAVETLRDDEEIIQLVKVVEDRDTRIAVEAERLLMAKIGGGCDIPAAAYARVVDNRITVEGMVADNPPNGEVFKEKAEGHVDDAAKIVEILAERLVSKKVKAAGV